MNWAESGGESSDRRWFISYELLLNLFRHGIHGVHGAQRRDLSQVETGS
jgi:hypothetical protein